MRKKTIVLLAFLLFLVPVFGADLVTKTGGTQVGTYTFSYPAAEQFLLRSTSGNYLDINSAGQAHVVLRGAVDDNNSSEVPLASGARFTGEATDILDYGIVFVNVTSDADSATEGLQIQQSCDGTNWDQVDAYSVSAGSGKTYSVQPACQYLRVVYTNGGSPQTYFRLHTTLKKTNSKPSSHSIVQPIVDDDDAELVKSVITGRREDGTYDNVAIDTMNRLKVAAQSYGYSVAQGAIANKYTLFKFGTRSSVSAGTSSTVWEGGTDIYSYLGSAQQLKVSSSSTLDTASGTGARTLVILGLDGNYDELSETVTLNGTSVVTTVGSYLRVFRAYVDTCGTGYTNAGILSVTNNAATVTHITIPAGDSQTLMSLWTVPRGHTFYLTNISASTNSNKGARVSVFTRELDGGTLYPWRIRYRAYVFSGNEEFPFDVPLKLTEKTDVQVRVLTPGSAGTTTFGATFAGWYELNE